MKKHLELFLPAVAAIMIASTPDARADVLPPNPSPAEILALGLFEEPLVSIGSPTTQQNTILAAAVNAWAARTDLDDFSALEDFLAAHESSPWSVPVRVNLASSYFRSGWFGKAAGHYQAAWNQTKNSPQAGYWADAAAAGYLGLLARVGRISEIQALLTEAGEREFQGSAGQKISQVKACLHEMLTNPGRCFKCGPMALESVLRARQTLTEAQAQQVFEIQSPQNGFNLHEVWQFSENLGMGLQMAFRESGEILPTPCVVHWKLNHYAAITKKEGERYHVEDPTFVQDFWVTHAAIGSEGSGYFLIPAGPLPEGWRGVGVAEAESVRGMGFTSALDNKALGAGDRKLGDVACAVGMPRASVHAMLVSLSIVDVPVGYRPAVGPPVAFGISYSQRDDSQPGTINHTSLGPRWRPEWLSYVVYDPNTPSASATVHVRGGGQEIYGFLTTNTLSSLTWATPTRLSRSASTGVMTFERLFPDGSKEVFAQDDGVPTAGATAKKAYLTQVVDPAGNTLTFGYDALRRIISATDSFGKTTTVSYENADIYKVTKVTDRFGRSAKFEYGTNGKLWKVTDVAEMATEFAYTNDFIHAMTTPYGTTSFAFGEAQMLRWLETTDPNGDKERVEYRNDSGPWNGYGPASEVPTPPPGTSLAILNSPMQARNTYYWDKKAWAEAPGDYTKAQVIHWLHSPGNQNQTDRIVESERKPFSTRVWFNYVGSGTNLVTSPGTTALPTRIARVVDAPGGGTETQLYQRAYNAIGNVTEAIDPMGRKTLFEYGTNNVDLLTVKQQGASGQEVLVAATYNAQHLPLTITDAAGQTTTYTYNTRGQPVTVNDANGGVRTLAYDAEGFLISVTGPLAGQVATFSPDAFGRVGSVTDPGGYTLSFQYDALDRLTKVTFPDGTTETRTYKYLDLASVKDRMGRVTLLWHNKLGQLAAVQDPLGRWTSYEWCRCGDLRSIRDALGRLTKWKHDVQGRVVAKIYPDNSQELLEYDISSRLRSVTDALGQVRSYTYNADDTLAKESFANEITPTADVTWTWDALYPRLASMADDTGTTAFAYHPPGSLGAGRLSAVDGPLADDTVTYGYDALGRTTNTAINGAANAQTMTYDAGSRLASVVNPLGQFDYSYLGTTGLLQGVSRTGILNTTMGYLPNNQGRFLASITHNKEFGVPASSFTYSRDAGGSITNWLQTQASGASNSVTTWGLAFDPAGQLTDVNVAGDSQGRGAYSYDLAGNRISAQTGNVVTTATYNALNQITAVTGGGRVRVSGVTDEAADVTVQGQAAQMTTATNFTALANVTPGTNTIAVVATDGSGNSRTNNYHAVVAGGAAHTFYYDPVGNLRSDGVRTFWWDAKNRLVKAQSGADIYEWTYNGLDQRVSESKNGNISKRWVWTGGLQPAEERNANNNVIKRFYPQGEMHGYSGYYYTRDHLGSVREMLNTVSAASASYRYDAWGQRTSVSGTDLASFGFTGHYTQPELGLVMAKYRAYDPATGRWLSRDPLGEAGGINLYGYVGNDAVNRFDPTGLWYIDINVTIGPLTGGFMGGESGFFPYIGPSTPTVAASIFWGGGDPTLGWNTAVNAGLPIGWGGSRGLADGDLMSNWFGGVLGGAWFSEYGVSSPGASLARYYVFGPFGKEVVAIRCDD